MTINRDSTFWSAIDDQMLDLWVEHGFPSTNDPVHAVDMAVRLRNRVRQWQGIVDELIASAPSLSDTDAQQHPAASQFPHTVASASIS